MSKQIKNMSADEIMALPKLGLDDSFEFHCKGCGKCCKDRHDILLTPYDVFRVASHLERTPYEILERYCEVYEGQTSHLSVVRVVPVPPDYHCPFLQKNGRCAVHQRKPVLCRTYPLARLVIESGNVKYMYNGAACSYPPKSITVREWLADVANDEAEQAGKIWIEIIAFIHPIVQPDNTKIPDGGRENMMAALFGALYVAYEMDKPFIPQFKGKLEQIQAVFGDLIPDAEPDN